VLVFASPASFERFALELGQPAASDVPPPGLAVPSPDVLGPVAERLGSRSSAHLIALLSRRGSSGRVLAHARGGASSDGPSSAEPAASRPSLELSRGDGAGVRLSPVTRASKLRVAGAEADHMRLYLRTFFRLPTSWVHWGVMGERSEPPATRRAGRAGSRARASRACTADRDA
jgi:hypothetical protein